MNLESGYLTAMRAEYQRLTGALPGEDSDIGIRMALLANQDVYKRQVRRGTGRAFGGLPGPE